MASLRNSAKRKEHKERSQPEGRQKHGLLEKKKDYKQRAQDFNKKRKAIKNLQGKAEERNPDEFYFAMQKQSTKDGVHVARSTEANKYSAAELALMRTQDIGYLRTKAQTEAKKSERLEQELHHIGASRPSNHTIFVDDQAAAQTLDVAEYFDTPAELVQRVYNRPRRAQVAACDVPDIDTKDAVHAPTRKVKASYHELKLRYDRREKVSRALGVMEMKQAVAGKGRKRKLDPLEAGTDRPVFKWRRERKKQRGHIDSSE